MRREPIGVRLSRAYMMASGSRGQTTNSRFGFGGDANVNRRLERLMKVSHFKVFC